ncbi:MAG: hypothetical protein JW888_12160, partial [Pirellulales bacterium]|nr:hypothetical protein [Pirellulales bacterium]
MTGPLKGQFDTARRAGQGTRRGLSTLELVLSLPLLLFVMALMINFGAAAAWRIRELSVARHAAWSNRHGHRLATDGAGATRKLPCWWPDGATMGAGGAGHLNELDDPRI